MRRGQFRLRSVDAIVETGESALARGTVGCETQARRFVELEAAEAVNGLAMAGGGRNGRGGDSADLAEESAAG